MVNSCGEARTAAALKRRRSLPSSGLVPSRRALGRPAVGAAARACKTGAILAAQVFADALIAARASSSTLITCCTLLDVRQCAGALPKMACHSSATWAGRSGPIVTAHCCLQKLAQASSVLQEAQTCELPTSACRPPAAAAASHRLDLLTQVTLNHVSSAPCLYYY